MQCRNPAAAVLPGKLPGLITKVVDHKMMAFTMTNNLRLFLQEVDRAFHPCSKDIWTEILIHTEF